MNTQNQRFAVGVDIGGTFTDFVLLDRESGEVTSGKTLTTSYDYAAAVLTGLRDLFERKGLVAADVSLLVHGTTLVINALIERKGARTAFIVTEGFRDVLRTRREMRYDIYDIGIVFPSPLVRARDTYEVGERVLASGRALKAVDLAEVERLGARLAAGDYEAAAICFLHSYRNPTHERVVEEVLRSRAPHLAISSSHRILAQWREYDRASATVMNAYTQPITRKYIERLEHGFRKLGFRGDWYVMAANAGVVAPSVAAEYPIRVLESGPVGGALAAASIAAQRGARDVLAFDMGGTTAKVCLIRDGAPLVTKDYEVARVERLKKGSGLPVGLPVIDMIEIGAGGGSIGRIDEVGLISVGPESAGALPGPACYNRGGGEATVTDANLLLGYLNPEYFLGGDMALDIQRAEEALARLGRGLNLSPVTAAWAVRSIVTGNMAELVRIHAVEGNVDYRKLDMVAFGGAGPLHAYDMARSLEIQRVIFPRAAGVFSSFGFLTASLSFDFVRTYVSAVDQLDVEVVRSLYAEMDQEIGQLVGRATVDQRDVRLRHAVDMRYLGQGYEIEVELPEDYLTTGRPDLLTTAFADAYGARYGRILPGAQAEAVNWRSVATGPRPEFNLLPQVTADAGGNADKGNRALFLSPSEGFRPCPVYDRYALRTGDVILGPSLVEERECTLFIGADARAFVDDFHNVVMELALKSDR